MNGGKKSLAVNLKSEEGVDIIHRLVREVDVVVENMTPRVKRDLGIEYAVLSEINPGLVMCSMSGFGQEGLDGDEARACTDPVAQAMSGISWITGERNGPPYAVGGGIGDTVTSAMGVIAILSALIGRERTGKGQYIDISMVESLAYLDCISLPSTAMNGRSRTFRNGQMNSHNFPMGPLKCTGGYIALQARGSGPDSPWGRLCSLMDRNDMIDDDRYRDDNARIAHADQVIAAIEDWLCSLADREGALALLASERISSGPVLSQEEMLEHRFFAERGMFGTIDYPELGPIRVVEPPFKFSNAAAYVRGPAPEVGEHVRDIVGSDLGFEDEEIDRLIKSDVLYESEGAKRRRGSRQT